MRRIIQRIWHRVSGYEELWPPPDAAPAKYMRRWRLIALWRKRRCYLHHYIGSDWTKDMHNHPKWFISIGLWGGYVEQTANGCTQYRAPWIRFFPAAHTHRLRVPKRGCWTLCFTGAEEQDWGFFAGTGFLNWQEYIYFCRAAPAKVGAKPYYKLAGQPAAASELREGDES